MTDEESEFSLAIKSKKSNKNINALDDLSSCSDANSQGSNSPSNQIPTIIDSSKKARGDLQKSNKIK